MQLWLRPDGLLRETRHMGRKRAGQVETDIYGGFVRRILRAYGRRIGAGDIAALPELAALHAEIDAALDDAVRQLRAEPWHYSWQQIADHLTAGGFKITRQGAIKRWSHVDGPDARKRGGQPAALR